LNTLSMPSPRLDTDPSFWFQWVLANLFGETLGLGLVGTIGYATLYVFGEPVSISYTLAFAALAIGLGGVEGAIVGYAQARVLRRRLPQLRAWVAATVVGAVVAWMLGMVPSTLMSLVTPPSAEPPPEISDALQLLLAVPLGLVTGAILGFPQWRVLRHHVPRAGWWVVANALAWGCGMPLVFVAAGVRPAGDALFVVLVSVGSLATTGALVGAIHGAFLVRLLAASSVLRNVD
jgi:hypothetical protein